MKGVPLTVKVTDGSNVVMLPYVQHEDGSISYDCKDGTVLTARSIEALTEAVIDKTERDLKALEGFLAEFGPTGTAEQFDGWMSTRG